MPFQITIDDLKGLISGYAPPHNLNYAGLCVCVKKLKPDAEPAFLEAVFYGKVSIDLRNFLQFEWERARMIEKQISSALNILAFSDDSKLKRKVRFKFYEIYFFTLTNLFIYSV